MSVDDKRCEYFAETPHMWAYLCACAKCGYSLPPIYYLCKKCWAEVHEEPICFVYKHKAWPLFSLWEWDQKGTVVHKLLDRRKKCSISTIEWQLAFWMLEALSPERRDSVDAVVFPSKNNRSKDHAWYLAHTVGEILNVPVFPVTIANVRAYKTFGRRQRAFERSKNLVSYIAYHGKAPLLIDDVVTTGATLDTIWRALGSPQYAVALCLAYKTFNPVDKI